MTTLTFPTLEDFIEYLIEHNIGRMGIVAIHHVEPAQPSGAFYTEKFRLSSIHYLDAKSIAKELLICDVIYYRSLSVTIKHNAEQAREPKEKALKRIMEKIDEICKKAKYKMKILNCKFDL